MEHSLAIDFNSSLTALSSISGAPKELINSLIRWAAARQCCFGAFSKPPAAAWRSS
jgi:hypothetical protein